jgi:hypothetical protein
MIDSCFSFWSSQSASIIIGGINVIANREIDFGGPKQKVSECTRVPCPKILPGPRFWRQTSVFDDRLFFYVIHSTQSPHLLSYIDVMILLSSVLPTKSRNFRAIGHKIHQSIPLRIATMSSNADVATRPLVPPFSYEDAVKKVRMAENAWNTRDPHKVSRHVVGKMSIRYVTRAVIPTNVYNPTPYPFSSTYRSKWHIPLNLSGEIVRHFFKAVMRLLNF